MLFLGLLLNFPLSEENFVFLKKEFLVEIHERSEGVFLGKKLPEKVSLLEIEELKLHLDSLMSCFFQAEHHYSPLPLFLFTI